MASTRGDKRRIEKRPPFISKQFPLPALCIVQQCSAVFSVNKQGVLQFSIIVQGCPPHLSQHLRLRRSPLATRPQLELGPETTRWEMREDHWEDSLFGAMTSKVKSTGFILVGEIALPGSL